MELTGFVAVGAGGALGCWLRWGLGLLLNQRFPNVPLGTLLANLAGCFAMGCVMALFDHYQMLPPALRLFVFTGFLGGLTTFSTFSAEACTLILRHRYGWFAAHVTVHLAGSLAMTAAGLVFTRDLLHV